MAAQAALKNPLKDPSQVSWTVRRSGSTAFSACWQQQKQSGSAAPLEQQMKVAPQPSADSGIRWFQGVLILWGRQDTMVPLLVHTLAACHRAWFHSVDSVLPQRSLPSRAPHQDGSAAWYGHHDTSLGSVSAVLEDLRYECQTFSRHHKDLWQPPLRISEASVGLPVDITAAVVSVF